MVKALKGGSKSVCKPRSNFTNHNFILGLEIFANFSTRSTKSTKCFTTGFNKIDSRGFTRLRKAHQLVSRELSLKTNKMTEKMTGTTKFENYQKDKTSVPVKNSSSSFFLPWFQSPTHAHDETYVKDLWRFITLTGAFRSLTRMIVNSVPWISNNL